MSEAPGKESARSVPYARPQLRASQGIITDTPGGKDFAVLKQRHGVGLASLIEVADQAPAWTGREWIDLGRFPKQSRLIAVRTVAIFEPG